jgi:branched-subunit amino acid aminotransferase/4-amino-4-deoxychorismate lyase
LKAFYEGKFVDEQELKIPFRDRGLLFGDGIFTSIRICKGRAEFLERHLERLRLQCRAIHILPPPLKAELVESFIQENGAETDFWRLKILVTGGCSEALSLHPRKGSLLMFLTPYTAPQIPLTLTLYPESVERPLNRLKSLSSLDRLLVKEYALSQGWDDAIVTNREGYWLEASFANIFWRYGEKLYTPKIDQPLLAGIALTALMEIMPFEQLTVKEIPQEAQLFLCNSLMGICPVTSVGSMKLSRDEKFEKELQERFSELVKSID